MDLSCLYGYVYKDMDGNVFYAGKGARDRTCKFKDRAQHPVLHCYIIKFIFKLTK